MLIGAGAFSFFSLSFFLLFRYGGNESNTCAEECCGITDGPGGHYCAYELKAGTYLSDQQNTMVALDNIRAFDAERNATGRPFFVGLGFHKPHLNWDFPREYWHKVPADSPNPKCGHLRQHFETSSRTFSALYGPARAMG